MNKEERLQMVKLMVKGLNLPLRNENSKWREYINDTSNAEFTRNCRHIRKELSRLIKEVK